MIKKGTIVLVPFPFTDLSGNKLRPALVISKIPDGDDVVVVFISSQKPKRIGKFDISVEIDSQNRLKANSVIKCSKIATLDKRVVIGELGNLSPKKLKEVEKKIKNFLGI